MRSRGVVAAVVVLLLVGVAGAALVLTGGLGGTTVSAEELDRVLLVAASANESGEVVGQIIAVVSVAERRVEPVSPALEVAIPGTSYSTLGDAYPFGGGEGTASAYERTSDELLPYVALTPEQLQIAIEGAGGLEVTLPADLSVFDGERLYAFEKGKQTLDAAEVRALLKGAPYLTSSERDELDTGLAEALADALGRSEVLGLTDLDTNLDDAALGELKAALSKTGSAS